MREATRDALVRPLRRYDHLVEVGIGRRVDVAEALARAGCRVVATDVEPRQVPPGVEFVRDDIVRPTLGVYEGADAIYALNLPQELQRPALAVARRVGAPLLFTTLGTEPPVIPTTSRQVLRDVLHEAIDSPDPRSTQ